MSKDRIKRDELRLKVTYFLK